MSNSTQVTPRSPATEWHLPRLTFTQGLLVGQLSIILVVVALLRYLLFEDTPHHSSDNKDNEKDSQVERPVNAKATRRAFFPSSPRRASSRQSLLSLSLSSAPSSHVKSPPTTFSSDPFPQSFGAGPTAAALARIPDVVGYDMETAADIDVGWLNVLLAHVWEGYRDDFLAGGSTRPLPDDVEGDIDENDEQGQWQDDEQNDSHDNTLQRTARDLIQDIVNRPKLEHGKLGFLDQIQVTECLIGDSYPILSNARVRPRDDQGRVQVEMDVDYTDLLSLSLQTSLLINYPRPRFGVLPISLGLRITHFSGTISLSFNSSPPQKTAPNKRSRHSLSLSLHPDFLLKATCSSLVGARAKLQDIPKIQQLILQRIRAAIGERLVWPKTFDVEMPDLVRRGTGRARRGRKSRSRSLGTGEDNFDERCADLSHDLAESSRMGGIAEEDEGSLGAGSDMMREDVYIPNGSSEALDPQLALQARRRRAKARAQAEAAARARDEIRRQMGDDLQQTPKAARGASQRNENGNMAIQREKSYTNGASLFQPHIDVNGGQYHDEPATIRQRRPPFLVDDRLNGNGTGTAANGGGGNGSHYTSISRRPPNPRFSSTPGPSASTPSAPGNVASKGQGRNSLARGHSVTGSRVNGESQGNGGRLPTVRDWVQRSNGGL